MLPPAHLFVTYIDEKENIDDTLTPQCYDDSECLHPSTGLSLPSDDEAHTYSRLNREPDEPGPHPGLRLVHATVWGGPHSCQWLVHATGRYYDSALIHQNYCYCYDNLKDNVYLRVSICVTETVTKLKMIIEHLLTDCISKL